MGSEGIGAWVIDSPPAAGELGPHVPDHLKGRRHVLQHLAHVLAQPAQFAAAFRADAAIDMGNLFARQMFG